MTYDAKCFELALHFLQDSGLPPGEVKQAVAADLAREIQRAVEDFLNYEAALNPPPDAAVDAAMEGDSK